MCGIAGFLGNFGAGACERLQLSLAHRGPDGVGIFEDAQQSVGLVHRRLSIIDLSQAARQPMEAVGGRYTVVFNGEIYNFKQLAVELKFKHYDFNMASDTAVLGPLYDMLAFEDMLDKLEGMFAFAIWDAKAKELVIARDGLGIKPLYYADVPNRGLIFASELKALLPFVNTAGDPDVEALADYMTLLWSPGERTMVKGIKKLRPGHALKAKMDKNGKVAIREWRWYTPPLPKRDGDGHGVYDSFISPATVRDLLQDVVEEQCVSDVPVGAFLSGGVDSSAIVAAMVKGGMPPAQTYCIGFSDAGMAGEGFSDDMTYARKVAKLLKVPLKPIVVDAKGILNRLPDLAFTLDEPQADPAPLLVRDICAAARADGIKVMMSGTGGDDVFSGYRRHVTARLRQRLGGWNNLSANVLNGISGMAGKMGAVALERRSGRLAGLLKGNDEAFLKGAFMTNSQPDAWHLLRADWRESLKDGWRNALDEAREESAGHDLLNRVLYMELFGFLPDHNLNYGDKASMAEGVEVRVPLIDRRLLKLMANVDPRRKLRGLTGAKHMLKQAMRHELPHDVLYRSKAGFGAPIRSWLVGDGKALVEDTLFANPIAKDWFDPKALMAFWHATKHGKVDGAYTILAVCMAVWWRERVGKA